MKNEINYQESEYHEKRHPDLIEDKELRVAWGHFADLAYFSHVKSKDSILEFGAGLGNNLLEVKNKAKTVKAVEPSPLGRRIASSDGIQSFPSLDDLGDETFDTILCRHVLEHLENPLETLQKFSKRLNASCLLVLVVPCEYMSKMPKNNDINQHLFAWSPRNLCNLLDRAGFCNYSVTWETFGGRKKLLPLYRKFGGKHYAKAVRLVGKIFHCRELVVVCNLPDTGEK